MTTTIVIVVTAVHVLIVINDSRNSLVGCVSMDLKVKYSI